MNALTRESIAYDCNNYLEMIGSGSSERLAEDDDRLTDDLCQKYADCLADSFDNDNDEEENAQNAIVWLLEELGIVEEPPKELDEETQRRITEIKMQIIKLQFELDSLEGD